MVSQLYTASPVIDIPQTTFFAAIEAQLLDIVTPDHPFTQSGVARAAAATISGALVVHVFAGAPKNVPRNT